MIHKYFDTFEFRKIYKLVYQDPFYAKTLFQDYLKRYPKDYVSYSYYAYLLTNIGQFNLASHVLDNIDSRYHLDSIFMLDNERVRKVQRNIYFNRLRLYAYRNQYEKFLNYYMSHEQNFNASDVYFNQAVFLARLKTNQFPSISREEKPYIFRQIIEYNENDFLDHIQKHFSYFEHEDGSQEECLFMNDFPFDEVFSEVKKYIPSHRKICSSFIDNSYVFRYDGCGKVHHKMKDFFKVVTFHNTQNFITMYPTVDCNRLPYVDLNYVRGTKDNVLVKKKNQIDKFYEKYKNM